MFERDLLQMFGPLICVMGISLVPLALVYMLKSFKLKERELELEVKSRNELRDLQQQALEQRLQANEQAVHALVEAVLAQRHLAPPVVPPAGLEEPLRTLGPLRNRG
ncbi:MAG: hypothetical protein JST92_11580 [Deltaproteobacteria bacterium]|nr:hypothetical protein [Deltaproteobacteria bacterium]